MIRFVSGKPGAGKTLYSVLALVEELRTTTRFIVTNMALEMKPWVDGGGKARKGLLASLEDVYGSTFEAEERIHFLKDSEVKQFYLVRPRWVPEEQRVAVERLELQDDKRFRMGKGVAGTCYFIDEAHEFYPASEWQDVARTTLSWASQQRRAGDDCYFLSQVIGNVAKPLRGVSQECVMLVNHRLQSIAMFRQPDMLSYRVYSSTPPGPSEHWLKAGKVQCKRDFVYGIYNTSKGVGVNANTKADIGVRAKGLHWSALIWIVVALFLAVLGVNKGLQGAIRKAVGFGPALVTNAVVVAPPVQAPVTNYVVSSPGLAPVAVPVVGVVEKPKEEPKPYVVSHLLVGASTNAFRPGVLLMSDGRQVPGEKIGKVFNGYVCDGYFLSEVPTGASNVTRLVQVKR